MSATLCGDIMRDIKERLHFRDDAAVIKVNTDRRNIKYVVQSFKSKADVSSLEFLLDFEKAIVYFDNKFDLLAAKNHMRRMALGKETLIRGYYFDFVEQSGKSFLMNELKKGNISILLFVLRIYQYLYRGLAVPVAIHNTRPSPQVPPFKYQPSSLNIQIPMSKAQPTIMVKSRPHRTTKFINPRNTDCKLRELATFKIPEGPAPIKLYRDGLKFDSGLLKRKEFLLE
ncbi:hypothetical protein BGW39_003090, partial [Mortierella sp. 14UC]